MDKKLHEEYLIYLENVTKKFKIRGEGEWKTSLLTAVDHVNFGIYPGETFGLVGESGCGKSTLAQTMLRLVEATEGAVYYQGRDIYKMNAKELQGIRREMQIVFQDPYDSLDPRMTLEQTMLEPFEIHGVGTREERRKRIRELFQMVGLPET